MFLWGSHIHMVLYCVVWLTWMLLPLVIVFSYENGYNRNFHYQIENKVFLVDCTGSGLAEYQG